MRNRRCGASGTMKMRITCPNCGAQYAVDPRVIPEEGRDVQCSSCGNVWYQLHPDQMLEPPEPPVEESLPIRKTDPEVMGILREEAERERAARAAEGAPLEAQAELDIAPPPGPPPRPSLAAVSHGDDRDPGAPSADDDEARALRSAPRRSLLPDIEEINSTLSPQGEEVDQPVVAAARRARENQGRRVGFAIAVGGFAALTLLYAQGPRIGAAVPAFAPSLDAYVAQVDRGRIWLDSALRRVASPGDLSTSETESEG